MSHAKVVIPSDGIDGDEILRGSIAQEIDGKLPPTIRNYVLVEINDDDSVKFKSVPLPIAAIAQQITETTGGWPRRFGSLLFADGPGGVSWLTNADELFAYVGHAAWRPCDFKTDHGLHTKKEVLSHLQMHVRNYLAVETLPHEPAIPDHFYSYRTSVKGTGEALRTLVNRFSPETTIDADLILAGFVTPFWGGRGGSRPAFCITSDAGRGCGKTKLAECIAQLAGGALDVSNQEDVATIKKRLLSPEGQTRRVVWIDNIKTSRMSWAELESLVTCPTISGHRLYVGEARRPNILTYLMTMNGVSLSQDMAQRSVIVKLQKPEYSPTWDDETKRFIESHRDELIADILAFLKMPITGLGKYSRWGDWERDVLSRLPDPAEAQMVISERRGAVDCDTEESSLIEDFIRARLFRLDYDVQTDRVFVPSTLIAKWLGWALNDRISTTRASQMLRQKIEDGTVKQLAVRKSHKNGRGFEFFGPDSTGETYVHIDVENRIVSRGDNPL